MAAYRHNDNHNLGLTIFLVILLYFIILFLDAFYFVKYAGCVDRLFSGASFVGFCFAAVVPILAGNSFYGRETAADILKVVLFYIITGLIPKTLKFHTSLISNKGEPQNPVSASGPTTSKGITPVRNSQTTKNPSPSTISSSARPTTSKGKTPVRNSQTTKNPPFAEKADNGVELQEIERQEDERGRLLTNSSG